MNRWTEWEQPRTSQYRRSRDMSYQPIIRPLTSGDVVAVRQVARPYLPTFAPWWLGLVVKSVDADSALLRREDGTTIRYDFATRPLHTHWALREGS